MCQCRVFLSPRALFPPPSAAAANSASVTFIFKPARLCNNMSELKMKAKSLANCGTLSNAFVALANTDEYTVYTATIGEKTLDGSRLISKQPYL